MTTNEVTPPERAFCQRLVEIGNRLRISGPISNIEGEVIAALDDLARASNPVRGGPLPEPDALLRFTDDTGRRWVVNYAIPPSRGDAYWEVSVGPGDQRYAWHPEVIKEVRGLDGRVLWSHP